MSLIAPERWPTVLVAVGLSLGGVVVVEVVAAATIVEPPDGFLPGLVTGVPLLFGFVYGSRWLRSSALPPERYRRVAGWCLIGAAGFGVVITAINLLVQPATGFVVLTTARWAASLGGTIGLFAGIRGAQTIEQQVARRQAAVRAEELEKRQELFRFLNALLRHEVLNTTTAIINYADLIERDVDLNDESREYVESIREQSQSTADVISDVRLLVRTIERSTSVTPVDLGDVLAGAVGDVRESYPEAQVEFDRPEEVSVEAGELLSRVFSNILENAVRHNDSDPPRVAVSVSAGPERVTVEIADNGPGVPEGKRDTLFDPDPPTGADHGLGLYLARTIAESYGGALELRETGPEGSVFVVSLSRAAGKPHSYGRA